MIFLLIVAGISLSANAVSWYNGSRTDAVREEILRLREEISRIRQADRLARLSIAGPYLHALERQCDQELELCREVSEELRAAKVKADQVLEKRFGAREASAFLRMHLELELLLDRLEGEEAHFQAVKACIQDVRNAEADLPEPDMLLVPADFPSTGGLIRLGAAVPQSIHGYRIRVLDAPRTEEEPVLFRKVDRDRRRVEVSATCAALLEATLQQGGALNATVTERTLEGLELSFRDSHLLLPFSGKGRLQWLSPGDEVEVHPEAWTLKDVLGKGERRPLPVRRYPRIEGDRERWSPILLSVREDQLLDIVEACNRIESAITEDRPWHVGIDDEGRVVFTLDNARFQTRADADKGVFVFESFGDVLPSSQPQVRLCAELQVLVAGSEEDADRSRFAPFLVALHEELSLKRSAQLQRQSALKFRKLSTVYQDQQAFLQSGASCAILVSSFSNGGKNIQASILGARTPEWLAQAFATSEFGRLRVSGSHGIWSISGGAFLRQELGTIHLELAPPKGASTADIHPLGLDRIELIGEGSQQQILSQALEKAIQGRFVSSAVHATLLGHAGQSHPNEHLGRESVGPLLNSELPVVAVWGPPGTGKTTLLVEWLMDRIRSKEPEQIPNILITAPTHVAVDNILKGLLKEAPALAQQIVRYSSAEGIVKVDAALRPLCLPHLLEAARTEPPAEESLLESWRQYQEVLATKAGRQAHAEWLLGGRRIHAVTCVGMARREFGLSRRAFDLALIDEAGKAFLAEILLPASVARQLVLVGDHYQLPPTVTSEAFDEGIDYRLSREEVESILKRNMFQDFFNELPPANKGMLTLQHRMHKDIGDLVSELFYEGRLDSARTSGDWPWSTHRVQVLDLSGSPQYVHRSNPEGPSIENVYERKVAFALLDRLQSLGWRQDVLLVCPYRFQRQHVESELARCSYSFQVSASTVDAVQGGQASLVILLMTRNQGPTEFLLDRNRLNVALSRAQEGVFILGHLGCLAPQGRGPIGQLVTLGRQRGTLRVVASRGGDGDLLRLVRFSLPRRKGQQEPQPLAP